MIFDNSKKEPCINALKSVRKYLNDTLNQVNFAVPKRFQYSNGPTNLKLQAWDLYKSINGIISSINSYCKRMVKAQEEAKEEIKRLNRNLLLTGDDKIIQWYAYNHGMNTDHVKNLLKDPNSGLTQEDVKEYYSDTNMLFKADEYGRRRMIYRTKDGAEMWLAERKMSIVDDPDEETKKRLIRASLGGISEEDYERMVKNGSLDPDKYWNETFNPNKHTNEQKTNARKANDNARANADNNLENLDNEYKDNPAVKGYGKKSSINVGDEKWNQEADRQEELIWTMVEVGLTAGIGATAGKALATGARITFGGARTAYSYGKSWNETKESGLSNEERSNEANSQALKTAVEETTKTVAALKYLHSPNLKDAEEAKKVTEYLKDKGIDYAKDVGRHSATTLVTGATTGKTSGQIGKDLGKGALEDLGDTGMGALGDATNWGIDLSKNTSLDVDYGKSQRVVNKVKNRSYSNNKSFGERLVEEGINEGLKKFNPFSK